MKLLPNCRDVTRLVLQEADRELSAPQRLLMRMHWMMCSACRTFRDQSRTLRGAMDPWRKYRDGL